MSAVLTAVLVFKLKQSQDIHLVHGTVKLYLLDIPVDTRMLATEYIKALVWCKRLNVFSEHLNKGVV